jgi:hypothetical protein
MQWRKTLPAWHACSAPICAALDSQPTKSTPPRPPTHLGAWRVLQASQPQEDQVALNGSILRGVCQLLVAPVPLAAIVIRQVSTQLCLGGKGQQAQRAACQSVQQPAAAGVATVRCISSGCAHACCPLPGYIIT